MNLQKSLLRGFKGKIQIHQIQDKVEAAMFRYSALGRCEQPHKLVSALTSQENERAHTQNPCPKTGTPKTICRNEFS